MQRVLAKTVAALATGSGLTRLARRRRRRRGDFRVLILEYHGITAGAEREGAVSADRFRRHLRYLKRHYRLRTAAAAAAALAAPEPLTEDIAVVTFDDGYLDNYEVAWPVLRDAGAPATLYLTSGFLDGGELWFDVARRALAAVPGGAASVPPPLAEHLRRGLGAWPPEEPVEPLMRRLKYSPPALRRETVAALAAAGGDLPPAARPMSWEQARQLCAAGVELGGHTVSHPILSMLEPAEQEEEIRRSRQRIAEEIGREPTTFAYPNGSAKDYSDHTVEILTRLGFAAACTTRRGSNRRGCPPMTLRRLGVGSDPLSMLEARLAGLFDEGVRAWLRRARPSRRNRRTDR